MKLFDKKIQCCHFGQKNALKERVFNENISKNPHSTLIIHDHFSNLNIPSRYTKFADIINPAHHYSKKFLKT